MKRYNTRSSARIARQPAERKALAPRSRKGLQNANVNKRHVNDALAGKKKKRTQAAGQMKKERRVLGKKSPRAIKAAGVNASSHSIHDDSGKMDVVSDDDFELELTVELSGDDDELNAAREELNEIDREDLEELRCQFVPEYIQDIMKYMKNSETKYQPEPDYMDFQYDVNIRMRKILIDWLVEVHAKFKLRTETLYLTVNIIDRFLQERSLSRSKLQLLGCTGMLLASKYEEIYAPEVRDFEYVSDNSCSRDDILKMEQVVLGVLKFNLTVVYPYRFAQRLVKVSGCSSVLLVISCFLCELTLIEYSMLKYRPSIVGAACVWLGMRILREQTSLENDSLEPSLDTSDYRWTKTLQVACGYSEEELKDCVDKLYDLKINAPTSSYKAVFKKYSSSNYRKVALLEAPEKSDLWTA